jgi:hypothetical protein
VFKLRREPAAIVDLDQKNLSWINKTLHLNDSGVGGLVTSVIAVAADAAVVLFVWRIAK